MVCDAGQAPDVEGNGVTKVLKTKGKRVICNCNKKYFPSWQEKRLYNKLK
jgi:hypothetical protein